MPTNIFLTLHSLYCEQNPTLLNWGDKQNHGLGDSCPSENRQPQQASDPRQNTWVLQGLQQKPCSRSASCSSPVKECLLLSLTKGYGFSSPGKPPSGQFPQVALKPVVVQQRQKLPSFSIRDIFVPHPEHLCFASAFHLDSFTATVALKCQQKVVARGKNISAGGRGVGRVPMASFSPSITLLTQPACP